MSNHQQPRRWAGRRHAVAVADGRRRGWPPTALFSRTQIGEHTAAAFPFPASHREQCALCLSASDRILIMRLSWINWRLAGRGMTDRRALSDRGARPRSYLMNAGCSSGEVHGTQTNDRAELGGPVAAAQPHNRPAQLEKIARCKSLCLQAPVMTVWT